MEAFRKIHGKEYGRGCRKAYRVGEKHALTIMKNFINAAFRLGMLTLIFTFNQNALSAQNTVLGLPNMAKYLNGVQTAEDLSQRSDIAAIAIKDASSAYYFTSDQAFEAWAANQPGGQAIIARNKALNNIYNYVVAHGYLDLDESGTLPDDLMGYIQKQIPGFVNKNQTEGALLCNFYDLSDYSGANKFCVGNFRANLKDFNNKANSALGAGTGIITFCDHKWFGGEKMHILNVTAFGVPDFGRMNNRIESYISF